MMYDAIVVGGSYAGLSASLQLARARRQILVMDGGSRRNRFAETSHGFLGQDGKAPGDIQAEARRQLMAYPTVSWMDAGAESAERTADGFAVSSGAAASRARRLVLATGVVDELPRIEGLAERWGRSVYHCPYCHGYELGRGRIGVLAASPMSIHHAIMLPDWGQTTFLLNGAFEPDARTAREAGQARRRDRAGPDRKDQRQGRCRAGRRPHACLRGAVHVDAHQHGEPASRAARLRLRGWADGRLHQDGWL